MKKKKGRFTIKLRTKYAQKKFKILKKDERIKDWFYLKLVRTNGTKLH
jgi:hypothetical protein